MSQDLPADQEHAVKMLEFKIDELIQLCLQLKEENQTLRHQHNTLLAERSKLVEKNEIARSRIEAMILRLKTMEHDYGQ